MTARAVGAGLRGRSSTRNVSLADVLLAKPDVIVASDPAFAAAVHALRG